MKILVTGANGYLGEKVFNLLQAKTNHQLIGVSNVESENIIVCDLLNELDSADLLRNIKPDIIIHTAAIVPKSSAEYDDKKTQSLNLKMIDNLLNGFKGKFVFCSSMTVYSNDSKMPVKEDDATGKNLSAYGLNKFEAENFIKNNPHVEHLILRFPGLFGAEREGGLIYNLAKYFKNDEDISLPKNPIMWAAMHVDDAARYLSDAVLLPQLKGIVNISYDEEYSINNLIDKFSNISKKETIKTIKHDSFQMDLNKLKTTPIFKDTKLKSRLEEIYNQC